MTKKQLQQRLLDLLSGAIGGSFQDPLLGLDEIVTFAEFGRWVGAIEGVLFTEEDGTVHGAGVLQAVYFEHFTSVDRLTEHLWKHRRNFV